MAGQANPVLRAIRKLAETEATRQLADAELLRRFTSERDEASFAALVRRHGPMVFRLCLRILHSEQDAEDAFQATYLVLTKKARSVQRHGSIGSWLFGVAYRTSSAMKRSAARRRGRERQAEEKPCPDPLAEISVREAQEKLDQELDLLPEKYRAPVILCCLEGMARDEAAQQLGLPLGVVKSRLEHARELLRQRLARRGVTLSGALLASMLYEQTAWAAVPSALLNSTTKAAMTVAAGGSATTVVSANVAALITGVLRTMFFSKLKITTMALLVVGIVGLAVGASILPTGTSASELVNKQQPPARNADRLSAAVEPKPVPDAKKNASDIQGTWAWVSLENGRPDGKGIQRSFEAGQDTWTFNEKKIINETIVDGKVHHNSTNDITVDMEKQPPRLTMHTKSHVIRYIFEVRGDTLRLCFFALDGVEEWPTEFSTEKQVDKHPTLCVLKRVARPGK